MAREPTTPSVAELLHTHREGILRTAAEHCAADVQVFGSVVRSEANGEEKPTAGVKRIHADDKGGESLRRRAPVGQPSWLEAGNIVFDGPNERLSLEEQTQPMFARPYV